MEQYKLAKLNDADNKLSGKWYVYYSFRHPESGQFTRFKLIISSSLKTKTARHERASIVIRTINQQLIQGWSPYVEENSQLMCIYDATQLYLTVKKSQLRPRSYYTYVYHMNRFLEYCTIKKIHNHPISMFDKKQAQIFLDWSVVKHKLNNRSYNNYVQTMRTLFNFLFERDIIITNPFTKIKKLQCQEASIIALTMPELKFVADTMPVYNARLWLAAQLVFYCFIRPQELVRMQYKHINIKDRFILMEPKMTKNKKQSIINIPDEFLKELEKLRWNYNAEWFLFSRKMEPGLKQSSVKLIYDTWHKYADLFKIKHTLYQLKHTGTGMAFDAGVNPRDIQLQSRHHSLDQTMQYVARFRNTPSQNLNNRFPKFGEK